LNEKSNPLNLEITKNTKPKLEKTAKLILIGKENKQSKSKEKVNFANVET